MILGGEGELEAKASAEAKLKAAAEAQQQREAPLLKRGGGGHYKKCNKAPNKVDSTSLLALQRKMIYLSEPLHLILFYLDGKEELEDFYSIGQVT
jgi:hypothetical protein